MDPSQWFCSCSFWTPDKIPKEPQRESLFKRADFAAVLKTHVVWSRFPIHFGGPVWEWFLMQWAYCRAGVRDMVPRPCPDINTDGLKWRYSIEYWSYCSYCRNCCYFPHYWRYRCIPIHSWWIRNCKWGKHGCSRSKYNLYKFSTRRNDPYESSMWKMWSPRSSIYSSIPTAFL